MGDTGTRQVSGLSLQSAWPSGGANPGQSWQLGPEGLRKLWELELLPQAILATVRVKRGSFSVTPD